MSYYLKVAKDDMSGLCNQVYSLAGCIEHCISKGIKRIVLDKFLKQIKTENKCIASDIIDLKKLNNLLKDYDLEVIDREYSEEKGQENDHKFLRSPILYLANSYDPRMFTYILNNISFSEKYNEIAKNQVRYDKINVIHLRLEEDALDVFSRTMNIHRDLYKSVNERRYIECISKYIDKNVMTVVLTGDTNNKVIEFLKDNKYKFMATEKVFNERELNALVDLFIGFMCTDVLIGCYDSSFSYTILNRVLNKRKSGFVSILIDMNKYNDFYRLYNYSTYTMYLNEKIPYLVFKDNSGNFCC